MEKAIEFLVFKQRISDLNYESLVELVKAQQEQIEELKLYVKSLERVIENSLSDSSDI